MRAERYLPQAGVNALQLGEDKTPYTMNWNYMIDLELPGRMMFETQYIGNRTDNALLTGNGTTENFIANINKIPLGGLYGTDTLTGVNYWQQNCASGNCAAPASNYYNGYRPYANYGVLDITRHGSYSNYHGLVTALQKQTGHQTFSSTTHGAKSSAFVTARPITAAAMEPPSIHSMFAPTMARWPMTTPTSSTRRTTSSCRASTAATESFAVLSMAGRFPATRRCSRVRRCSPTPTVP